RRRARAEASLRRLVGHFLDLGDALHLDAQTHDVEPRVLGRRIAGGPCGAARGPARRGHDAVENLRAAQRIDEGLAIRKPAAGPPDLALAELDDLAVAGDAY